MRRCCGPTSRCPPGRCFKAQLDVRFQGGCCCRRPPHPYSAIACGPLPELRHTLGELENKSGVVGGHAISFQLPNRVPLMSYKQGCGGCARIPYWSNPRIMYNGEPTGTAATVAATGAEVMVSIAVISAAASAVSTIVIVGGALAITNGSAIDEPRLRPSRGRGQPRSPPLNAVVFSLEKFNAQLVDFVAHCVSC
jgi:hypothetical protein